MRFNAIVLEDNGGGSGAGNGNGKGKVGLRRKRSPQSNGKMSNQLVSLAEHKNAIRKMSFS